MLDRYQHLPEHIEPVMFTIGFFSVHWYALMYILALCVSGYVLRQRTKDWLSFDRYLDLVFDLMLGVLVGSRLGYVLLYNVSFYATHPLAVISPFDIRTGEWIGIAGMSYYGGLAGAVVGLWLFARRENVSFRRLADAVAFAAPIGIFFGRIGNFLNGELYGRVTETMWGMYFPNSIAGNVLRRHPSQLYEAFFEGVILFFVLMRFRKKEYAPGMLAAVFVIAYAFFRFFIEMFREPDPQIGFIFGWMTTGQILAVLSSVGGIGFFFWLREKKYGTIEAKTIKQGK